MNIRPKILIVDDKFENLVALKTVLRDLDVELVEATSGNEALKATLYHDFALALLDIQMPEMDGYELASILREEEKTADLPFIFISAVYTDNLNVFKGYEKGAFSFITKPFQPEVLINKVKFFIEKHTQEHTLHKLNDDLENKKLELEKTVISQNNSLTKISNFKALFEEAPGLYLILLPDFTIDAVSDEYLKATMTNREGIIGKNLFEVFPDNPDDPIADGENNLRASLNLVLKNKEAHSMAIQKYDIRKPGGDFEVRYWSPLNKAVLNENNEVVYLIHSVEDITLRLKHEQELKDSFKEIADYKYALDESAIVSITDQKGIIKHANFNFCHVSKYSLEELVGKDHNIINSEYHTKKFMRDIWTTIANGKLWKGEIRNKAKDGTFYWVDTAIIPFLNDQGKPFQYMAIRFDITKQKEQQESLIKQQAELFDYYTLFESSIDMVGIASLDGYFKKINPAFLETLGWSGKEFLSRPFIEYVHPDDVSATIKEVEKLGKGYKTLNFINRYKTKSGNFLTIQWTTVPDNETGNLYCIGRDITEAKLLEDKLKVQQEELVESNTELEAQTQKLQASEEELKLQQEELMQLNQELEEKSQLLEEKNQIVSEKNEELKAASYELYEKAQELAQSSKYKSEFLANMSHELRTPLNSILLLSKLLSDNGGKNLNNEQVEFASVIHNSGNGLLELINDILDLSKIESGKMDLEVENVSLIAVSKSMNDIFKPLAKQKEIFFSINKSEDVKDLLKTDRIRIEQVLKNFLSNAFKFTEKGNIELIIRKPSEKEIKKMKIKGDEYVSLEVKDSGIGIPAEKYEMVFEAFQQADGSTRRKYGGTGLGLSISREIARMLGGEIILESKMGKGSSFTLIIPYENKVSASELFIQSVNSNEKNINPLEESEAIILETDKYVVQYTPNEIPDDRLEIKPKDKAILIVEDDTAFAQALIKYIHERGYKAVVAVSGGDAVAYALKYKPIGILLDIQLPIKSGWAVMKELKTNLATKFIPVHMMSSMEILARDTITLGAIDFISKPLADKEMGKVLDKIEMAIGKSPKNILLVDDNKVHTEAISQYISDASKTCLIANSADEAYKILKDESVDCIVLDMGLPNENGYKVLETIKNDKKFETLPVIIYTGKSLSLQEERRLKQYTTAIVIKTADSFKRLASEISLFLHLVEDNKEEQIPKKPYMKDKVLAHKHILIVDDDVRNIFSLTKLLEGQKMKVSSACDGNEAISILNSNKGINLVLMDMMMPNKDGYEATREIRNNSTLKKMPVIAVTAKAMLGDREKCISAGANDYITKPVDGDQLLSLLRIWLYK